MKHLIYILLFCCSSFAYGQNNKSFFLVLGTAQDGGYPHTGCTKKCCARAWQNNSLRRYVVALALVDPASKKWWLFEATPDIKEQLQYFRELTDSAYNYLPDGIFVTHAHIGHYTGLMQLGREVMNTNGVPVYALPKMQAFLESNGPWSQLVKLHNILIRPMQANRSLQLTKDISVTAFTVPHRDEYSETAGFEITTNKKYLFIPDIDKWEKWDHSIMEEVDHVDCALLDGTFYSNTELPGRNISEVPHPLVSETMELFNNSTLKSKITFIHFNHTNPALWDTATQQKVAKNGFHIAHQGQRL